MTHLHRGDLRWYKGLLLYCEGRIGKSNKYLFTDPWGDEYRITIEDLLLHEEVSFTKSSRWLPLH